MTSPAYLLRSPEMITGRRPANPTGDLTLNGRPSPEPVQPGRRRHPAAGDLIAAGKS